MNEILLGLLGSVAAGTLLVMRRPRRRDVREALPSRPFRPDTDFPVYWVANWSDPERDRALTVRSDDGLPLHFH